MSTAMWGFDFKKNVLREQMLLTAPEADPHQFVRRFLLGKSRSRTQQPRAQVRETSPTGPRREVLTRVAR